MAGHREFPKFLGIVSLCAELLLIMTSHILLFNLTHWLLAQLHDRLTASFEEKPWIWRLWSNSVCRIIRQFRLPLKYRYRKVTEQRQKQLIIGRRDTEFHKLKSYLIRRNLLRFCIYRVLRWWCRYTWIQLWVILWHVAESLTNQKSAGIINQ